MDGRLDALPLEDATREELSKLCELRAAVPPLRAELARSCSRAPSLLSSRPTARFAPQVLTLQGLAAPPASWLRVFYKDYWLLYWLRSKKGSVKVAAARAAVIIPFMEEVLQRAKRHEAADRRAARELYLGWGPMSYYGVDRRGSAVLYYSLTLNDSSGQVRETGLDAWLGQDACVPRPNL
jgi:hypothetical protein